MAGVASSPTAGSRLQWTLLAAVASAVAYVILLLLVRRNPRSHLDLTATLALQRNHHPLIEGVMSYVSWFGFRPQSLLLPLTALAGFWKLGFRLEALLLVFAWGSSGFSFLSKQLVRRPRPDHTLVRVVIARIRDSSFPSGHVVHYLTFWGFFVYLLLTRVRHSRVRLALAAVFGPLLALVGPSRIYLGHHWTSDVLGSILLSTAYLTGLITIYHWIQRALPSTRPDQRDDSWRAGASQWLR
jgi:membrane-associated phospholipid phosphatase